jgi:hypothetical protein
MLTHVTLELPEVLATAGLPIVRLLRCPLVITTDHTLCSRISQGRASQDIAWVGNPRLYPVKVFSTRILGGHGALTLYLASKTNQYRSVSAFSPICNPVNCPWGQKAFDGYLQGGVKEAAGLYDATELVKKRADPVHILIDYVCSDAGPALYCL